MGTFRAVITGLCAFIPDQEFGNPQRPPTKVCVAMVDARPTLRNKSKKGLDRRKLRYHHPVLIFSPLDVKGVDPHYIHIPPTDLEHVSERGVLYYLSRLRDERWEITFELQEQRGANNKFNVIQAGRGNFNDAAHVNNLADIQGLKIKLDPKLFKDSESAGIIATRLILSAGTLSTFTLNEEMKWLIPGTLGGQPLKADASLAHLALLEFDNVDAVTLNARNLEQGESLKFTFSCSTKDVSIGIGNLCCDSLEPLKEEPSVGSFKKQRRDSDFRWFYELFDDKSKKKLRKKIGGVSIPVPFPIHDNSGSGFKVVQCLRVNSVKAKF
jgi:hypothetical protein